MVVVVTRKILSCYKRISQLIHNDILGQYQPPFRKRKVAIFMPKGKKEDKFLVGHLDYLKGSIYPDVTEITDIRDLFVDLFFEGIRDSREFLDKWSDSMFPCTQGIYQNGHYTKRYQLPFMPNVDIYTGYIIGKKNDGEYVTEPEFSHCFIEIKGSGLEAYRNLYHHGNADMHLVERLLVDYDFQPTRVDACIDDYFEHINLSTLARIVEDGYYSGAFRNSPKVIRSRDGGLSVYFGSGQSDLMIRMYNKLAERKVKINEHYSKEFAKGVIDDEIKSDGISFNQEYYENLVEIYNEQSSEEQKKIIQEIDGGSWAIEKKLQLDVMDIDTWQRYELQMRSKIGLKFLRQLIGFDVVANLDTGEVIEYDSVADIVLDYLNSKVKILKNRDEKGLKIPLMGSGNKSKMKTWKPWKKFVENSNRIDTSVMVKAPSTFEHSIAWNNIMYGEIEQDLEWLEKNGISLSRLVKKNRTIDSKKRVEDFIMRQYDLPLERRIELVSKYYKETEE